MYGSVDEGALAALKMFGERMVKTMRNRLPAECNATWLAWHNLSIFPIIIHFREAISCFIKGKQCDNLEIVLARK